MYGVIYKITNLINGNFYIGQTKMSLMDRWSKHKSDARNGFGWVLASAIRKHGELNFSIEILEERESKEELNLAEIRVIAETKPAYNACAGGGGLGSPSPQVRAKISKAMKGRKVSDKTRQLMSIANKGRKPSPVATQKLLAAASIRHEGIRQKNLRQYGSIKKPKNKKIYLSPHEVFYQKVNAKTKNEKLSAVAKLQYDNGERTPMTGDQNPRFGRSMPEDIKARLSKDNSGSGNPFYGSKHTDTTKEKMRAAHAARPPVLCPYCKKSGQLNAMKRWHFEKCRSIL